MITTQKKVRELFWESHPEFKEHYKATKRQNDYNCEIRSAFVSFVDQLHREKRISDKLAGRVIL